ncbi:MAG: SAM-dependent chlorinase/fluorinase [Bacteroidales bacterium]|nr:SAM-dependent chlorinase/fluorinase [Bacteroidales bacterium]MDD2424691.1 SAM-dependent chlorinase/fluorinase [Bacteroidales bacterium]MDD3989861.1 SAM-dependent chlorinase/fluorinase [Bacteroidales bacterium]MDD4638447.1 SAM-dependent chlorinase/fluorinase [Bacteroidales bacterium]
MTIVTITSDWNRGDYYLATLKGSLLSVREDLRIVEITNSITCYDVLQEVFVLRNSYASFPKGTIHLMCVMSEPAAGFPMVIVFADGHYFIGLNDGRFSLLFSEPPSIAFEIERDHTGSSFSSPGLFAKGVRIITANTFQTETKAVEILKEITTEVVTGDDQIIGKVVYIDSFGNAITDISKIVFDRLHKGRDFTIFIQGPRARIERISQSYSQHSPGELLALFNSVGMLELAVNQGNITALEGLGVSSEIRIKFYN